MSSPVVPVTVNSGWFAIAPVASIASNVATTPDSKRSSARHSDSPSMSGMRVAERGDDLVGLAEPHAQRAQPVRAGVDHHAAARGGRGRTATGRSPP